MQTILVTGIAGFIGSHVAQKLVEKNYQVIGVDNFNSYYSPLLKEGRVKNLLVRQKENIYRFDIARRSDLEKIFSNNKIDKICHLAAQAGVRYSFENPDAYISANIIGTHNLLELAKKYNVKDFIFASSSSVYGGNKALPFEETATVNHPVSLYAATKVANEIEAYTYHHLYGLNCWGLRFFTVYGPWGRPDMALFKFTKAILDGQPIDVYNQGQHQRDFTYIGDIVSGVIAAIEKCQGYEIFNLGNNQPVELEYFISVIEKTLGKKAIKNYLPLQPGDVIATYANIDKAKNFLGFNPKTKIDEGIEKFIAWYKNYQNILK
ncbi:GDP-mannose 4,6-dehydratase [Candidatus Falkowbacteria bacterium]|nr:GDP-mannose 4,6-dehydratase [Candidatus Falkowbacteria bacterium]